MSNSNRHTNEVHDASVQGVATRRDFLQGSLAAAGAALTSSLAPSALSVRTKAKRPNLVFFLGEGQRADALSIAGNPILKTPNQDRIGREGLRFENAFCTNALCAPARATELTGMYSRSTGALSNAPPERSPWEWCAHWFSAERDLTATTNPLGPEAGEARVMKGGSFLCHKSYCNRYRVAARSSNTPDSSTSHMSFRCAADVQ